MKTLSLLNVLLLSVFFVNCAGKSYPEQMTASERSRYYADYTNSHAPAEWDSIHTASQEKLATTPPSTPVMVRPAATQNSVAIRLKNNSLFSQKVKILGNVLDFGPFEVRYVGFPAGTKAYLHQGRKDKDTFLFTIAAVDGGKTFNLF